MTPHRQFAFRLALALGYANPDAMLAEIPERILQEWVVYYREEPWDEERADWRAAMIAWTMASIWHEKGPKPRIENFMPKFGLRERPKTAYQGLNAMKNLIQLYGGEIQDNRPEWKKRRDGLYN